MLCVALLASVARGQASPRTPFWDGLDPGSHEVGFQSYWARHDYLEALRLEPNRAGLSDKLSRLGATSKKETR
jgi:hypothetical protein